MERAVDDDSDDDISSEDEDEIQEVVENMAEDVAKEHFKSECELSSAVFRLFRVVVLESHTIALSSSR